MFHRNAGSRPVYLNLAKIKLPVPGLMSIMHRISGVLMVLAIPFVIYLMERSLSSPEGFAQAGAWLICGCRHTLGKTWEVDLTGPLDD